jgi:hypothetical protein
MDLSGMKDMFQQVRTAQKQMKEMQKELGKMRIEAETGAGVVKAIVDGEANLLELKIDDSILNPSELKNLPKLVLKAVQEAQKKAKKEAMDKAKGMAGGLKIPGLGL